MSKDQILNLCRTCLDVCASQLDTFILSYFLLRPAPTITAKVFLDLHVTKNKKVKDNHRIGDEASGRIVLGLFGDLCPKIVETFLSLTRVSTEAIGSTTNNSSKPILSYKGSTFHR